MQRLLLIGLGGAVGTLLRYGVTVLCEQRFGTLLPYGTFAVNFVGSFLLGVIMQVGLTTEVISPTMRLVLGTGLMGGFTTYSTFNYETLRFIEQGAWRTGLVNVGATLFGCLAAGLAGFAVAKRLFAG